MLPQYVEKIHLQYSSYLSYAYVMEVRQEYMDSSIVIQGMPGMYMALYLLLMHD